MKACLFAGDRLVLPEDASELPTVEEARGWDAGEKAWFPATASRPAAWDGVHAAVAARAAPGWTPPEGVSAIGMRQAIVLLQEPDLSIAITAAHLARWRHTSRFCGVCGTATEPSRRHQAMVCRSCGHLAFPKVSPAVIVQVTRGDRILLGRSRRHPHGGYSVLAGFVDPGERLEDTVRREVEEESGIRVRNVRYFGSQPWPFPDSLMVGFTADYDGGEIHSGDDELLDVAWFRADALPPVPPAYSIARALIDGFARSNGVDPSRIPTWQRR
ncbi:MAG: NAD(+) diphosphatase [Gemmatimonadetes bacterium]|nr:NAD(+) diphosphatase [Gemmatimonadota bacterium]MYE70710.1 NAD(+) diphosphatase [Gemmatimonadota bacterium]MYJ68700.1 NAD(+) diphosphatase [Gemmatimonadota bacterium]